MVVATMVALLAEGSPTIALRPWYATIAVVTWTAACGGAIVGTDSWHSRNGTGAGGWGSGDGPMVLIAM